MKLIKSLILAALIFSSSGCVTAVVHPKVDVPERPALSLPAERPSISGSVIEQSGQIVVVLPFDAAIQLRDYILKLEESIIILQGHLEKLENRLKALGE
jgi:hypothetical protein